MYPTEVIVKETDIMKYLLSLQTFVNVFDVTPG